MSNLRQGIDAGAAAAGLLLEQHLRPTAYDLVGGHLVDREFDGHRDFGLLRQLLNDLLLGTAEDEGLNDAPQLPGALLIVLLLDGDDVFLREVVVAAQEARIDELAEIPELTEVIRR